MFANAIYLENFSFNYFLQWFFAVLIGTIVTLALFVLMPSISYKDPVNPEPLVEIEILPLQQIQPEPVRQLPEKKSEVKPKPVAKAQVAPAKNPKPVIAEKSVPVPEPTPVTEPQPIVPEKIAEPITTNNDNISLPPEVVAMEEALPTPVPLFQLTNLPRFIRKINPVFPQSLKQQGLSGEVKLNVLIDATGKVRDIEIVSATHPDFAQAAIDAIKNSSFQPAEVNDKPVATRYKIPFKFSLQ